MVQSRIKKPSEMPIAAFVKALIYGPPGIGKSTLGLSAPKPLYIDCDNDYYRISSVHQTDAIDAQTWEDVTSVLEDDIREYDTIVINTIGKMLLLMNDYLGRQNSKFRQSDGNLSIKGFGARKIMFIEFLNKVTKLGKHVVFIAHDIEAKKPDGGLLIRPEVGGSSGADMIKEMDLVGYVESIGNTRTISFDATEAHYGKNTCGLPNSMDLYNLAKSKNTFLTDIFKTFQNGITERYNMRASYNSLMSQIENKVSAIKTASDANDVFKWLTEFPSHIWESQREGKLLIFNKATELGLIANKVTKQFEAPEPPAESKKK